MAAGADVENIRGAPRVEALIRTEKKRLQNATQGTFRPCIPLHLADTAWAAIAYVIKNNRLTVRIPSKIPPEVSRDTLIYSLKCYAVIIKPIQMASQHFN